MCTYLSVCLSVSIRVTSLFIRLEWTVTLAGTYQDDMAPDVQMHLSFPQRSSSQGKVMVKRQLRAASPSLQRPSLNGNQHNVDDDDDDFNESIGNDVQQAIMPAQPTNQLNLNPRRTLSRNYYSSGRFVTRVRLKYCEDAVCWTERFRDFIFFPFFLLQNCNRRENIPMQMATEIVYGWKTTIFPMWIRIAKIQIELLQSKRQRKPSRYLTGLTICFSATKQTHTYNRYTHSNIRCTLAASPTTTVLTIRLLHR